MTRITTGTIPDYGAEIEGLRLSGVMAGGPAARAGLEAGDIIVGMAGVTVGNIYDYMGALDLLKADEPAAVVFMRDGERREDATRAGGQGLVSRQLKFGEALNRGKCL